jgi:hypothetical protein
MSWRGTTGPSTQSTGSTPVQAAAGLTAACAQGGQEVAPWVAQRQAQLVEADNLRRARPQSWIEVVSAPAARDPRDLATLDRAGPGVEGGPRCVGTLILGVAAAGAATAPVAATVAAVIVVVVLAGLL